MTIDDLKNGGKPVAPTITDGFIPTLEELPDQSTPNIYANKGHILDIGANKSITPPQKQINNSVPKMKADLGNLPKSESEKTSSVVSKTEAEARTKVNEIFAAGGPFDQYKEAKTKEALSFIADRDAKAVMQENESDEDDIKNKMNDIDNFEDESEDKEIIQDNTTDSYEDTSTPVKELDFLAEDKEEVSGEDIQITREMETSSNVIETNDLDAEEEDVAEEKSEEDAKDEADRVELIKSLVTEKLKPVSKRLDITGYTIATKGTTSSFVLDSVPVAKWPLINTGIVIKMKEILGSNLEKIRFAFSNNDNKTAMKIIYDHIVSPKPDTLSAWMKSIAFDDYDHLFMAIYFAAFADSNYIPIDCNNPGCKKKTYLTDSIPIMRMVKFKNANVKKKFEDLNKAEPTESKGLYSVNMIPISERFAIGFVVPSLYSVLVESSYFDDKFLNKYNNVVSMLPYIDQIYQINSATKALIPIEWKEYSNNMAKSLKSRVIRYDGIFDTMTADELAILHAYIDELNSSSDDVTYQIPETTCPYCGHVNPAVENQSASSLVFTRNQLGRLAIISKN